MPSEKDKKTRVGLLQSLVKLEAIEGTLRNIDPEMTVTRTPLRRARGLARGLQLQTMDLLNICRKVEEGEEPESQLTIPMLKRGARKAVEGFGTGEDGKGDEAVIGEADQIGRQVEAEDKEEDDPTPKKKGRKLAAVPDPEED